MAKPSEKLILQSQDLAKPPEKLILQSRALLEYILETDTYPRQHEQLKKLREATINEYGNLSVLNVPADEGQFLSIFLKVMNAKNTLEIGVFTGFSLLTTALALPVDGKVTAIDMDRKAFEVGLPFIEAAGVAHKINFINGDVFSVLNDLINDGKEGEFDFAFVDANKKEYMKYFEPLMKLVRVGGVIAFDNTLWWGTVAEPEDKVDESFKTYRQYARELNSFLATNPRIETSLLSIGDGLTLCRRLY